MLAAGWVVDENGALRRETIHHMGRRLPGWDYRRRGYYVITIVLENRRSGALGELRVKAARRKSPDFPRFGIDFAGCGVI